MSERNDGGPAFPVQDMSKWQVPGMSLRDWFAGVAMNGMMSNAEWNWDFSRLAESAYQAADAMLKARER